VFELTIPAVKHLAAAAYPAAIAMAYTLTRYLDAGLQLLTGLRAALVAAVIAVVITVLAMALLRDRDRGAMLAALVVMMVATSHQQRVPEVLGLLAIAVVLERLLSRSRRIPGVLILHRVVPVFGLALLIVTVAQFPLRGGISAVPPARAASPATAGPDIWVVLLDGYPRADVLSQVYGWDAEPFLGRLHGLGFDIACFSRSNYVSTSQTVPSMLGMHLLHPMPNRERVRATQDNRVSTILRERGYEIVALASGHPPVDLRLADSFLDPGTVESVELALLTDSAIREVIDSIAPTFATEQRRRLVESNISAIHALIPEVEPRARFIWAHIMAPHAPALFGPSGETPPVRLKGMEFYTGPGGSAADHRDRYVANLAHLDALILPALTKLVQVDPSAVIIVMSDHGPRSRGRTSVESPAEVHERFGSLFAARTPGHPGLFGEVITPVNVFGNLFEAYFGLEVEPQPALLIDEVGIEHPNPDLGRSACDESTRPRVPV
jgi:hypothetical protein